MTAQTTRTYDHNASAKTKRDEDYRARKRMGHLVRRWSYNNPKTGRMEYMLDVISELRQLKKRVPRYPYRS